MRSSSLNRKTRLVRKTPLRRTWWKRKPYRWKRPRSRHDWTNMRVETWRAAGGKCERCDRTLPLDTPPAHLKPRSAGGSDRPENLALLCLWGSLCHHYLDSNPGEVAETEAWLQKRMEDSEEVRVYFERQVSRREYKTEMKRREL